MLPSVCSRHDGTEHMKMPKKIASLLIAMIFAVMTAPVDAAGERKPRAGIGLGVGGIGVRIGPTAGTKKRRIRQHKRGKFIAPSRAAKRAQRAFPGKILGVRLRGGVYVVKLRASNHIRIVLVDARTGQIVGR